MQSDGRCAWGSTPLRGAPGGGIGQVSSAPAGSKPLPLGYRTLQGACDRLRLAGCAEGQQCAAGLRRMQRALAGKEPGAGEVRQRRWRRTWKTPHARFLQATAAALVSQNKQRGCADSGPLGMGSAAARAHAKTGQQALPPPPPKQVARPLRLCCVCCAARGTHGGGRGGLTEGLQAEGRRWGGWSGFGVFLAAESSSLPCHPFLQVRLLPQAPDQAPSPSFQAGFVGLAQPGYLTHLTRRMPGGSPDSPEQPQLGTASKQPPAVLPTRAGPAHQARGVSTAMVALHVLLLTVAATMVSEVMLELVAHR